MSAINSRESWLASCERVEKEVRKIHIRGHGDVYIKELSIADADAQLADSEGKENVRTKLARGACRYICDETGQRFMDPDNADDVATMGRQPLRVLRAINKAGDDDDKADDSGN